MWAARADVEKRCRQDLGAVVDLDATGLFEDEEASRPVARVDEAERRAETRDDRLEAEGQLGFRAPSRHDNGGHGERKRQRQPSLRSGDGHTPIIAVSRSGNSQLRVGVEPG
jgi:hypothetical protein